MPEEFQVVDRERFLDMLNEKRAEEFGYSSNDILGVVELQRTWPQVPENEYARACATLRYFTDLKNDTRSYTVTDPVCGEKVYPGVWRQVDTAFTKLRQGAPGIIQTLRKGWAQGVSWDEARLARSDSLKATDAVGFDVASADEEYLNIIFPAFDPGKARAAATALRGNTTLANFSVQGYRFTGTYEIIHVRTDESEDGSHTISLLLAQPRAMLRTYQNWGTPDATAVYYLWNVPKRNAQAIVDHATYRTTGADAIANYSTENGTIDITIRSADRTQVTISNYQVHNSCMERVYHTYYYGYTKAQAEAFTIPTSRQGVMYSIPRLMQTDRDTYAILVVKHVSIAYNKTFKLEESIDATVTALVKKNDTTNPETETFLDTVGTFERITSFNINENCTIDKVKTKDITNEVSVTFTIETNDGITETHIVAWNQRTISMPELPAGKVQRIEYFSRNLKDGTYDWYVRQMEDDGTKDWSGPIYRYVDIPLYRRKYNPTDGTYTEQKRKLKYLVGNYMFSSSYDAYAWISVASPQLEGTDVTPIRKNEWLAQFVQKSSDTGWVTDYDA